MTNRQARVFAVVSTAVAALIFLVLTVDSHRQFPELTNSENITPQVRSGMDVWHNYNCINCHTLFGEGAYYAPDLTKITQHRGEAYLKAFMANPAQFYDEQKHRRLMPNQGLSEEEIDHLIQFLDWVANVDNQGWPPRPIMISGSYGPGAAAVVDTGEDGLADSRVPGARPVTADDDDRAQGEHLFRAVTPACNACHSTLPGADMAGPTLAGMATRASERVASDEYQGDATDAAGYIRESIVEPSAHLVPGAMYSAGETSFMPAGYSESLSEKQIEQLTEYLLTLK